MRPTVRGLTVVVLGASAVGMAYVAGARALNAIAAPALIAVVAAALQVALTDAPTVDRSDPLAGYPGETRTVSLDLDGSGTARVTDRLPAGVTTAGNEVRATLPATLSYDLQLTSRGEWTVGPPTVAVTDVLGLFVDTHEPSGTASVLVYPEVVDLRDHEAFVDLFEYGSTSDRQAFDTIREYAPGDPLRDVHWKSSAKRGDNDLVVKEFVAEQASKELHVAASAEPGYADAMASAAASIAVLALSAGLSVGVTCPAGSIPAGRGETHQHHVLELLARTGDGYADDRAVEAADVTVTATDGRVVATVDGQDHTLIVESGDSTTAAADGGSTVGVNR